MTDQEGSEKKFYSPAEAAKYLGISVTMLRYYRLTGRIQGTDMRNTTVYTEQQLKAADLTPKKPGPKGPREKSDDEMGHAAAQPWDSCPVALAVAV